MSMPTLMNVINDGKAPLRIVKKIAYKFYTKFYNNYLS